MILKQLHLHQFRLFADEVFHFEPDINIISGANACGKTTVLEGLWCGVNGQSFRTVYLDDVIAEDKELAQIHMAFDADQSHKIGFSRAHGQSKFNHNTQALTSPQSISQLVPMLFIGPDSLRCLMEAPALRRKFLDRALFLQNPDYFKIWKDYRRTLLQRNSCLKQRLDKTVIMAWEAGLISLADQLTQLRQAYLEQLLPKMQTYLHRFFPDINFAEVELRYAPGYPRKMSYAEVIERQRALDQKQQFTGSGPHRADIEILYKQTKLANRLSRGQLKIATYALYFAQLAVNHDAGVYPLLLLDDFSSELDERYRTMILETISEQSIRTLITTVDAQLVPIAANEIRLSSA